MSRAVPAWTAVVTLAVTLFALVPAALGQPAGEGDTAAGRGAFEANCAMWHGSDASGMMGMHPSLRGAVERLSREGVEITVRKGRQVTPPMPAFERTLTDQQIADVVAYIASLPTGPRNFGPDSMMGDNGMRGDGSMMGRRAGVGVVEVLVGVLTTVLVLLAVLALVWVASGRRPPRLPAVPSAREELDRRYAAGELSRDDYLQRRADLES